MHFFSLDGVDWRDTVAKEQHYVGSAITDFAARTAEGAANPLEPVKKENIPRVIGSAALRMQDHNYISLPHAVADNGTPIVINNACASWHRLAETYAFGNARMYIGTLFPVMGAEAHDVVVQLLDKHFRRTAYRGPMVRATGSLWRWQCSATLYRGWRISAAAASDARRRSCLCGSMPVTLATAVGSASR